jgi:hypothetical protein
MMKAKVNLETGTAIRKFVEVCSRVPEAVYLIDGENFCVSAKSLLGAVATMDWREVYVTCEKDIRAYILDFLAD